MFKLLVSFLCVCCICYACGNCGSKSHSATTSYTMDTLIYAKDSVLFRQDKIMQTLDLTAYKPDTVIYKLQQIDSGATKKTIVEAVLFYEEHTYADILTKYMDNDFPKGNYEKEAFNFEWLNENIRKELNFSKPDYHGNPDIFLNTDGKGKLWFLNKKILVKLDK